MLQDSRIAFIVAMDENRLIGRDQALPWRLPDDLAWFRRQTVGKPCIMGRKTYDSLPAIFRPLPDRHNIVVTKQMDYHAPGATVVHSLAEALEMAGPAEEIIIVGGGQLFNDLLPYADRIYLTSVHNKTDGDIYFPAYEPGEWIEIFCEEHPVDERHAHAFTWQIIDRHHSQDASTLLSRKKQAGQVNDQPAVLDR